MANERLKVRIGGFQFAAVALSVGAAAALLFLIYPLFLPSSHSRHGRRGNCGSNLKQIWLALKSYHDRYGSFPPAYIADADGKPMHSWRVLVLPFFEEPSFKALYDKYDFDEPWDGPNNKQLDRVIPILVCPSTRNESFLETSYLAVVGRETVWPGAQSKSKKDIEDARESTILLVEVANSGIHWMEPRDLSFEQAITGIRQGDFPDAQLVISSFHTDGANVLFVDGSVRFLNNQTPAETLRALLTAAGVEPVSDAALK